jgi:hypothetical protein
MTNLNETFVIDLTDEQRELLEPYIMSIKPGETMFAQVYGDGMRVKKMTPEQSTAIQIALMGEVSLENYSNSAFKEHSPMSKRRPQ